MSIRSLEANSPSPDEIGSMGYFRLLQHHYWEFLINYSKSGDEIFRKLITAGELSIREECAKTLELVCTYAGSFEDWDPDDLALKVYISTLTDARTRINIFEDRFVNLLYGSEVEWLRVVYPDQRAAALLEEAISSFDKHLEYDQPEMMGEALRLHRSYRNHLKGIDEAYGGKKSGREQGVSVMKSIELLDSEADDIFVLAVSSGQEWVK